MKLAPFSILLSFCLVCHAEADLTIVQRADGAGRGGGEVTIRIKGDLARVDVTPQISTIVDGRTGEVLTLMKDQKAVVRISAKKMKAAAEMISKFSDQKKTEAGPARLQPTGRKETINGYEAEEYTIDTPMFKAAYWLAPKYPDGAAILRQLQAVKSDIWNSANGNVPNYRDFPALPVKTVIELGKATLTTTLVSVSQSPLNDADFAIPKDFREVDSPALSNAPPTDKTAPSSSPPSHP